jgi:hypothetical protein
MHIEQARHKRFAVAIDDRRSGSCARGRADGCDPIAKDQNVGRRSKPPADYIEHAHVTEKYLVWLLLLCEEILCRAQKTDYERPDKVETSS